LEVLSCQEEKECQDIEETKEMIIEEYRGGTSVRRLSQRYGISRYAIQNWCGLRKEVEFLHDAPFKGRPRTNPETQERVIKRLQMGNELLRDFLSAVGRMLSQG